MSEVPFQSDFTVHETKIWSSLIGHVRRAVCIDVFDLIFCICYLLYIIINCCVTVLFSSYVTVLFSIGHLCMYNVFDYCSSISLTLVTAKPICLAPLYAVACIIVDGSCWSVSLLEVDRLWLRFQQLQCNANGVLTQAVLQQPPASNDPVVRNVSAQLLQGRDT